MPMDMIEHEVANVAVGALASRVHVDIQTIGTSAGILNRTFLIKKMEIEFCYLPSFVLDDASTLQSNVGYLILQDESSGSNTDQPAEAFDAQLEDKAVHESVIWSRIFVFVNPLQDDTDNISFPATNVIFKTSKSFPKGFPLDKTKTYQWKIFNPTTLAYIDGGLAYLRVRYWGVYL